MIPGVKSYSATKSVETKRLGKIPVHWELARFKRLLKERDSRSLDGDEQLLRVSQYTGVTQRATNSGAQEPNTRAESLVGYKRVDHHDLVVNIMLAWNGSMGVSDFSGITSPAYCVYRFNPIAHPRYFHYLLRSNPYKARIKAESTGVVESRLRLYTDDLFRFEAHLPPPAEQTAIARFLDHMDRRIQKYIRAKEKLIALLDEYKQVLIHDAVTGRIDVRTGKPYVDYKSSGVEWLGDVPKHWKVQRLCTIASISTGGKDTVDARDDGKYPLFVRSQTVERGQTWAFDGEAVLTAGDGVGVGRVFHYVNGRFDFHQRVYKFSEFRGILGRMFFHYIRALLRFEVMQGTAKSTVDSLRLPRLRNFPIAVPPDIEQVALGTYIDETEAKIDKTVSNFRDEVARLGEYRTRLIADVVTGKLDVREAAANLPNIDRIGDEDAPESLRCEPAP